LEQVAVDWLRQLFELPGEFGGVLTTGATMANFVALAAARNWWGELQGVDVEADGVANVGVPGILSSGYLHASVVQAVGMLGLGRRNIRRLAIDDVGRLDLAALERELEQAEGPAIVVANAGEVNAGEFARSRRSPICARAAGPSCTSTAPLACSGAWRPAHGRSLRMWSGPTR
jgi:glutamate/tyrosine decarboxylase-like PLP-dependent enzyme